MSTGRVAEWHGIEDVRLVEVATPDPGPNDVLLRIGACGICGSDVHRYSEGAWSIPGTRLGHEYSGTVLAVGAEVDGIRTGDRVAVNPARSCGVCPACADGRTNLCAERASEQGGFGDQVLLREARRDEQLFVMPPWMSFEEGAFVEPLAVALRAVRLADLEPADPVVVSGLGTIGQCVVRVLAAHGHSEILGVDTSERRREAAAPVTSATLDPGTTDVFAAVVDRWGSQCSPYQVATGAAAVIECSGAVLALDAALRLVCPGGVLVLAGLCSTPPAVDVNTLVQKEVRLHGSFAYTVEDAREAFALLREACVDVAPLVSHRIFLSEVDRAFRLQRNVADSLKVMVVPDRALGNYP